MKLLSSGNREAVEELYERYYLKLRYFIYNQTGDWELSEDIIHDVFIKIIEKPSMFDVTKKFSTWIYTIAANAGKNTHRNHTNRQRILKQNAVTTDWVTMADSENPDRKFLAQTVNKLLTELSEKERTVYLLRFVEGFSIPEISKIAEIPEGSVKSCLYYLLKKLKDHLKIFENGL